MAFNLREIGVKWHDASLGLTLWIHPGNSFWKLSEVMSRLDLLIPHNKDAEAKGDHVANNFRNAFLVSEAFILDYEVDDTGSDELPIVQYLKHRSSFDFESNLQGFRTCLSYEQAMIFYRAWLDTRPKTETSEAEPTEEEKKS